MNQWETESCMTFTENGALAYQHTKNYCLDLFAAAGALRGAEPGRIKEMFAMAFNENADDAVKILFYARDIHGGLGERRLFRIILRHLAFQYPKTVRKNLDNIPEYGRFDDCMELLNTPCESSLINMIKNQLNSDIADMQAEKPISLMAKWLPSINTSSYFVREQGRRICKLLRMSEKEYRKMLSKLRTYMDVLEKRLCAKDYSFDYESIPSKALYQYRNAFWKNDRIRYKAFFNKVESGKATLKTKSLFPYDIVRNCMKPQRKEQRRILDLTWNTLPNHANDENAIAVVDGSESMYWNYHGGLIPITVAVSLGIYFAERCKGFYHNKFITFSRTPRLINLIKGDIYCKVKDCMTYNECQNTNLESVFRLILNAAILNNLAQNELPKKIYIISDMEFDEQTGNSKTIFQSMKENYKAAGYTLPLIVYWNVCSRNEQYPVREDEIGAILVSGGSPFIFKTLMNRYDTPEEYMRSVLDSERYRKITA